MDEYVDEEIGEQMDGRRREEMDEMKQQMSDD